MSNDPYPIPETITRQSIQAVSFTLYDPGSDGVANGETQSGSYEFQEKYSNGEIKTFSGDLVPHLTSAEITGILALMDRARAKIHDVRIGT